MSESITVSALNRYVKIMLETDEVLSQIWVEGEIRSFKQHSGSGHAYFSLFEGGASVRCVMFCERVSKVRFVIEEGMYAVLRCRVSLYER
ncbi:MAG: exodeoxyribonuclease VII large subunit, partial [Oscillospiraceae bacterium]|nr:exodeoxyribonuclease VII large subunit [Oscillospiraceae bacterium]